MKFSLFNTFFLFSLFSFSQDKTYYFSDLSFTTIEDSLKALGNKVLLGENDSVKLANNKIFLDVWQRALRLKGSWNFPFDSVITVARLKSKDNFMRIINWHIPFSNGTFMYYGIIQCNYPDGTREFVLNDMSEGLRNAETKTMNASKWYGAHYYKIVEPKEKKKTKSYTLLGWDGNNPYSTKKIIEILSFNENGDPVFGATVFKGLKKMQSRFILEYNKDAFVSLKYDEKAKIIFFDRLVPRDPALEGQYEYYIPDFTHDAFKFSGGNWKFIENLDLRAKTDKKTVKNTK